MYKGKTILAIIPARGGSKGLPRKNIRELCGKPLIAWTIEQALNAKCLDKIIVSTDDPDIADISKKYGAEIPFLRPKELARDDSPTIDVITHALEFFKTQGNNFDVVILLEPTSPLRKKDDIDKAVAKFIENYDIADSLVGVCKIESDIHHPYGVKKIENNYLKPFLQDSPTFYQRQQLPDAYGIYGGIYISKVDTLMQYKSFYQTRTIPYFLERWQSYEIDDIYDFLCVETILKKVLEEGSLQ